MQSVVLIGATQGIGRDLAAEYAHRGDRIVITGRTEERAAEVAMELSKKAAGPVTGLALDLTAPDKITEALATVGQVDRLAIAGMVRDRNTIADYDIARATGLAVTKVVGYTTVVSALAPRMAPDASVLLFGGAAAYHPYPGSTTVTTVNAAVAGLVRTMSVELAPIRVNAIHPGMIEDSPQWAGQPELLAGPRKAALTGRLGTMSDVTEGCLFLLENRLVNGINLRLDGGHAS